MSRYRRRYSDRSRGWDYAMEHIEEARSFSVEIGGCDNIIKRYFFGLSSGELDSFMRAYGKQYGTKAEDYARRTFPHWKSGSRMMSGLVAKRLFSLLPEYMDAKNKLGLATKLWQVLSPASRMQVYIGVDTPIEKVLSFVQGELQKEIAMDRIPDALKNRFEWLFGQDVQAQETLLRNFCHSEIELILEKLKLEIPVLQNQVNTKQEETLKINSTVKVNKHEICILFRELSGEKDREGNESLKPQHHETPRKKKEFNELQQLFFAFLIASGCAIFLHELWQRF